MLATVAHEYGHLCGDHGKMGAWIYRQRRTLLALYEQVEDMSESSWAHELMYNVLRRFMPRYDAYTFVLSRQQEYEADKTASEIAGAKHNATGLIRDELLARWIGENFWPTFYKQARSAGGTRIFPVRLHAHCVWHELRRLGYRAATVGGVARIIRRDRYAPMPARARGSRG